MSTFRVYASYDASTVGDLVLPDGIEFDKLVDWYIKWDIFNYTRDGEKWEEAPLNSDTQGVVDWKRPSSANIYEVDEEGNEEEVGDC